MATFSGRAGNVSIGSELANVRNWTVTVSSTAAQGNHSDVTDHWGDAYAGVRSWSGSCDTYMAAALSGKAITVGAAAALTLTDGTAGTYTGTVVVSEVSYNVDIEGGELVNTSISFVGDGALNWT